MLDIKSKLVLKILVKECPNGSYNIVDAKDIISAMPNRYKIDIDGLYNIMIYLERQEFISIKYDDDGIYCLCVLPFGNEVLENETQQKRENHKFSPLWVFLILNILTTFCSGIIGVILARVLGL